MLSEGSLKTANHPPWSWTLQRPSHPSPRPQEGTQLLQQHRGSGSASGAPQGPCSSDPASVSGSVQVFLRLRAWQEPKGQVLGKAVGGGSASEGQAARGEAGTRSGRGRRWGCAHEGQAGASASGQGAGGRHSPLWLWKTAWGFISSAEKWSVLRRGEATEPPRAWRMDKGSWCATVPERGAWAPGTQAGGGGADTSRTSHGCQAAGAHQAETPERARSLILSGRRQGF